MANARGLFGDMLARIGGAVFTLLSKWEGRGLFLKASRWLKLAMLGAMVALIAACGKKARPDDGLVTCYAMAQMNVNFSEVSAVPNPTKGAHRVQVKARVGVGENEAEGTYIRDAWLRFGPDTSQIKLKAEDGRFSDTVEIISARIDVSGLEPGTTWVYLTTSTSQGGYGTYTIPLVISEKE